MNVAFRTVLLSGAVIIVGYAMACGGSSQPSTSPTTPPTTVPTTNSAAIASDAALFKLVSQTEPFGSYSLFPNADAVTRGTLNGSTAHQPMVRVSMNAKALAALQNGKLPSGGTFPDGSIIFKEVQTNGATMIYVVLYKDSSNPRAGNGWLWAEFSPSGSVAYSIDGRGAACTGCHSLEQGPKNDFVRTFERQQSAALPTPKVSIAGDSALFKLVTETEPFSSYALFPNADAVTRGTLNGSTAHQPMVRVSVNAKALAALQNGKLPSGGTFPDGSIIFKEIQTNGGSTTTYAVLYKEVSNPAAGNGWLWSEFSPGGSVAYSINNRGAGCTGCHSLEQGSKNDFVRTFERQRP